MLFAVRDEHNRQIFYIGVGTCPAVFWAAKLFLFTVTSGHLQSRLWRLKTDIFDRKCPAVFVPTKLGVFHETSRHFTALSVMSKVGMYPDVTVAT